MFDASEQILKLKSTFSSSLMKIRNHENIKYDGAMFPLVFRKGR